MKLLDHVAVEARLNTRVLHLEGETIFSFAKRKLDLPPEDDTNSYRHDQVNYSIPKLGKGVCPAQVWALGRCTPSHEQAQSSVMSSNPLGALQKSDFSMHPGSESAN